jgi:O-antigen ligase
MQLTDRSGITNPALQLARWLEYGTVACLFLVAAFAPNSIALTQTAWLLGILFWLLRFAIFPRPQLHQTPIDYLMFGFFILTGLTAFLSYEPFVSIGKLRAASLFTIVYLVSQNIPSKRLLRLLVLTLVAAAAVNVIFTIGERALGRGVKITELQMTSPLYVAGIRAGDTVLKVNNQKVSNPDELVSAIVMSAQPLAQVKIYRHEWQPVMKVERAKLLGGATAARQLGIDSWSRGRDWRASGFFGHYVTYAEALQLLLAVVVGLLLSAQKSQWKLRLALLATLVGLIFALILTVTRASWLAFLVASTVIVLFGAGRRTLVFAGLLAIPLVIAGVFVLQQKRNVGFVDQSDGSTAWRQIVWREGYQLLTSNPRHLLIGIGMDSIKSHRREWGMFQQGRIPIGHMHSNLLQIALERGVLALLLWVALLGMYGLTLLRLLRKLKRAPEQDHSELVGAWIDRGLVLGALGGLIGFFVSGIVHYNWGDSEVVMIFYLLMGLTLALERMVRQGTSESQPSSA